jgi:hypothetical protein
MATIDDLQYLAAYVITETASQDGKVGGPIQLAIIGVGMPQVLDASAVQQIILANDERSRVLKTSFLTNQYKEGRTPRPASLVSALKAPLEAMDSRAPIGVPVGKSSAPMDSLSTVATESVEKCSSGLAW